AGVGPGSDVVERVAPLVGDDEAANALALQSLAEFAEDLDLRPKRIEHERRLDHQLIGRNRLGNAAEIVRNTFGIVLEQLPDAAIDVEMELRAVIGRPDLLH